MPLFIWEDDSKNGDFCNTESQHEYQNGNLTDAVEAEAEALDRGDRAEWQDGPIDEREPYDVSPGQRFNRWDAERDSQGVDYPRRK